MNLSKITFPDEFKINDDWNDENGGGECCLDVIHGGEVFVLNVESVHRDVDELKWEEEKPGDSVNYPENLRREKEVDE